VNLVREKIVKANGVDLCVETFGDPADPAILLIMGSGASMDWWEDEFCERLAAGSRLVIRYDHRDTGRSISYEPGAPEYTFADLVDDAVGLLDSLGVARAHLVGMSMGGAIAQLAALNHPERVASLTLVSTSPAGPNEPDLPSMSEEGAALFTIDHPDWTDRTAVVDHMVHLASASASPSRRFDEAALRGLAGRVFDRTANIASTMTNHNLIDGGERWRERLAELRVPTLVVHGSDDPVLPLGHGRALANEIPGAGLLVLEHTGHELPPAAWDLVIPAILEQTSGG
jgi:pimeloyl-ACP methyl ester carboxylesterase